MPIQSMTALSELQALINSSKPVAIDFYATWCGPCRMISPRFEALSEKFPSITFVKVDVDQAGEIAQNMQISAMPTFVFFKDGKKVTTVVGADPTQLEAALARVA